MIPIKTMELFITSKTNKKFWEKREDEHILNIFKEFESSAISDQNKHMHDCQCKNEKSPKCKTIYCVFLFPTRLKSLSKIFLISETNI